MNRRVFLQRAAGGAMALGASGLLLPWGMRLANAAAPHPFFGRSFDDVDGRQVAFTEFLGKPVVLNFWATWCPPCVREMPELDALHHKYTGMHFVGLAVDTTKNVRKFGEKVQVSYPLLVAGHQGIGMMRDLGNKQGGLPFTVVFDAQGQLKHEILGEVDPAALDAYLKSLS